MSAPDRVRSFRSVLLWLFWLGVTGLLTAILSVTARAEFKKYPLALAFDGAWVLRRQYGELRDWYFQPEILGQTYISLAGERLFLRPQLGVFYFWQEAEMPRAVYFREREGGVSCGVSLLWDGAIVPSMGMGLRLTRRTTRLSLSPLLEAQAPLVNETRWFLNGEIQWGVGIPLWLGSPVVLEPFFRIQGRSAPSEYNNALGVQVSFELF